MKYSLSGNKYLCLLSALFFCACKTNSDSNNSDLNLHLLPRTASQSSGTVAVIPMQASESENKSSESITSSQNTPDNQTKNLEVSKSTVALPGNEQILVYNDAGPQLSNGIQNEQDDDDAEVVVDEKGVQTSSTDEEILAEDSSQSPEDVGEQVASAVTPLDGPIESSFSLCDGNIYLKQWEINFNKNWLQENSKRYKRAKERNRALDLAKSQAVAQLIFPMVEKVEADYPTVINKDVINWIEYFQTSGRKAMVTWLKRAEDVIPAALPILDKYGLPRDLVFLSMIESGFNNKALSIAGALGAWQFMPATGKMYGLRIDDFVDERRDPERATDAAARYLSDLYSSLGDWHLAAASYNAGEGRIRKAKRSSPNSSFFALSDAKLLPNETRNYVPKLIAALFIGKNPGLFGFEVQQGSMAIASKKIKLTKAVVLDDIAKLANIDLNILESMNPELRVGITPPATAKSPYYELKVPETHKLQVEAIVADLKEASLVRLVSGRVSKTESVPRFSARHNVAVKDFLASNPKLTEKSKVVKGQTVWLTVKLGTGQYEKLTAKSYAKKSKKYLAARAKKKKKISRTRLASNDDMPVETFAKVKKKTKKNSTSKTKNKS